MGEAVFRVDPVTVEEFEAMSFGDRKAELIDGIVVVAQAFPTSRHADIAGGIVTALNTALRAAGRPCRAQTGAGITVRQERDYRLGPDALVHCGGDRTQAGVPVLVVEILSPSNRPSDLTRKLDAYRSLETLTDILLVDQDRYRVEHWFREAGDGWSAQLVEGEGTVLRLPAFAAAWTLPDFYGDPA